MITIKERVKTFTSRIVVYEEDGVLKMYRAPATTPYDEFVANFERDKGVKFDPVTGNCAPIENAETPCQEEKHDDAVVAATNDNARCGE
ncbi:MAG: hypothetical protein IJU03_00545 [Thermoguttaceae bacterium]|nr:hypothetical protein [Thermoguttaceae bacterium]